MFSQDEIIIIAGAVFSTIHDFIRKLFKSDISVTINVDVFHLETGKKKHIEKVFSIWSITPIIFVPLINKFF